LWIGKKAFTKPFFSEFLQVKLEEYCAAQDEAGKHLRSGFRCHGYKLIMLIGMKIAPFLLLSSNENDTENLSESKLFYFAVRDLCTKSLCCAAAEIFNTIYQSCFLADRK